MVSPATKKADLGGIDTPPSANYLVVHNPAKCSVFWRSTQGHGEISFPFGNHPPPHPLFSLRSQTATSQLAGFRNNCRTHASLLSVCSACKQWTNPWMPSNMFMTVKDPKRIKSRTKRPISQLTSLTSWKKLSWTVRLSPVRRQCIARGRPILLELNLWELWEWEPTFSETSTSPRWCYWFLYRPGPAECPSWSGPWPNRPSNWSGFFQGTCHEQMS